MCNFTLYHFNSCNQSICAFCLVLIPTIFSSFQSERFAYFAGLSFCLSGLYLQFRAPLPSRSLAPPKCSFFISPHSPSSFLPYRSQFTFTTATQFAHFKCSFISFHFPALQMVSITFFLFFWSFASFRK